MIAEQIKLRNNGLRQSEVLMDYKRLFVHHPTHLRRSDQNSRGQEGDEDGEDGGNSLLSILVSLLADPLSRTGSSRTDADHLTIELVLHLFRNLLSAEPIMKGSADASHRAAVIHQELVCLFERELVLDVLLIISQEMEARENAQYNLLLMEILHHLFRGQDPALVAGLQSKQTLSEESQGGRKGSRAVGLSGSNRGRANPSAQTHTGAGSLRSQLRMERQKLTAGTSARHSHFGGTLVSVRPDGRQQYVSAGALGASGSGSAGGARQTRIAPAEGHSVTGPARRRNRKTEPFVGSGRTSAYHAKPGAATSREAGAVTQRARRTLHRFCSKFVATCYGPVMKSLKNEFRRDSVRLEDGDKAIFFRIVWFFYQWWRLSQMEAGDGMTRGIDAAMQGEEKKSAVGQLIFTMDVFTFNLVFTSTETFFQHKKHPDLMQAVALYQEMMQLLRDMYHSEDATEHVMALGLMDRIFYGADPVDRLPKLLSRWTSATYTREYLCDLVELCHVTLSLLETNAKHCMKKNSSADMRKDGNAKKSDAVERMNATAAEFDFHSYFAKKIISSHVVLMYTRLLSQYAVNASRINDIIAAFFVRLSKFEIALPEEDDDKAEGFAAKVKEIAIKRTTLEPMLYNIQTLIVFDSILNDPALRDDRTSASLVSFSAVIVRHFAKAAEDNPMLFVECLMKHSNPHRFCEHSTNLYITEEIRMMAEREMLLDESRRAMQEDSDEDEEDPASAPRDGGWTGQVASSVGAVARPPAYNESDDEGEVEFGDNGEDNQAIVGAKERIDALAKKIRKRNRNMTEQERMEEAERDKRQREKKAEGSLQAGKVQDIPSDDESAEDNARQAEEGEGGAADAGPDDDKSDVGGALPGGPKRIKRAANALVESDDEEMDFGAGATETTAKKSGTNSSRNIFGDDSDDE